jgi:hypothetical protein
LDRDWNAWEQRAVEIQLKAVYLSFDRLIFLSKRRNKWSEFTIDKQQKPWSSSSGPIGQIAFYHRHLSVDQFLCHHPKR